MRSNVRVVLRMQLHFEHATTQHGTIQRVPTVVLILCSTQLRYRCRRLAHLISRKLRRVLPKVSLSPEFNQKAIQKYQTKSSKLDFRSDRKNTSLQSVMQAKDTFTVGALRWSRVRLLWRCHSQGSRLGD